MPPARSCRHVGVRHGGQLFAPCRVEASEQERDDRVVVDRADRTPADGAESAARTRRGSPRGRASARADPRDAVAREFDPCGRQRTRVSLAHPAGAGVRVRRGADRPETDVRAEASTLEVRCFHGPGSTLHVVGAPHAGKYVIAIPIGRMLPAMAVAESSDSGRRMAHLPSHDAVPEGNHSGREPLRCRPTTTEADRPAAAPRAGSGRSAGNRIDMLDALFSAKDNAQNACVSTTRESVSRACRSGPAGAGARSAAHVTCLGRVRVAGRVALQIGPHILRL